MCNVFPNIALFLQQTDMRTHHETKNQAANSPRPHLLSCQTGLERVNTVMTASAEYAEPMHCKLQKQLDDLNKHRNG